MNKILSIIAICAILGLATADWSPTSLLAQTELAKFGNRVLLARYSDNTQLVLLGFNVATAGNSVAISRRYLTPAFAKVNATGVDDFFPTVALNGTTGSGFSATWSQDGKVGLVVTTSNNVIVSIFKSDADLNTSSNIQTSANLFANAASGTYTINQFYFQDDVFYVLATDSAGNSLLQGVASKDASLKTTTGSPVVTAVLNSGVRCAQRSGSGVESFCGYSSAGVYKYKNISVGADKTTSNTESNVLSVNPAPPSTSNILIAASNDFYLAAVGYGNTANSNISYNVAYDNQTAPLTYTGTVLDNATLPNFVTSQEFFQSGVVAVYNNAKGLFYSLVIRADTATASVTSTNSTGTLVTGNAPVVSQDFILQDQTYYLVFADAQNGVSIGQVIAGPISSNFGSATKCALASILAVAALLFAF